MIEEHVRKPKLLTELVFTGASDFKHVDPNYDGGLTGSYKSTIT